MFKYLLVVSAAGGASAAISSLESMARSGSLRPAHMTHTSADPGPNVNAGVYLDNLRCGLHPNVNLTSVEGYHGEIQGLWQPYCATNRGIFVLQPGNPGWENQTYSCGRLPTDWAIGNDIGKLINYPAPVALHALGQYMEAVFNTSDVISPDSCDYHGLGQLTCNSSAPGQADIVRTEPWRAAPWVNLLHTKGAPQKNPLRGVNVGGLFVLEPWITPALDPTIPWSDTVRDQYTFSQQPGALAILEKHWTTWYTADDFTQMASMGLNHVRLPVGWWYFAADAGLSPSPYVVPTQSTTADDHPITAIVKMAQAAKLMVIIDLHGAPSSQNGLDNSGRRSMDTQVENWGDSWLYNETALKDTTSVLVAITKWINGLNTKGVDNIIMLELVNEPWVFGDISRVRDWYFDSITAIRVENATLPLLIHDSFRHSEWTFLLHHWTFTNVFMDTHLYHAFNIEDLASSNPECDKSKQIAHENLGCRYGSLLRYKTCISLPTHIGEFSLAIDNCVPQLQGSTDKANQFLNFGQCENVAARSGDPWWNAHIRSFAMRQISQYENELGWSFWTYKLGSAAQEADIRTQVWCFRCAVKLGWIDTNYPTNLCEHQLPDYPGC